MKFLIKDLDASHQKALSQLIPDLISNEDGIQVQFVKHDKKELNISYQENTLTIYGQKDVHFYRGLHLFKIKYDKQETLTLHETINFNQTGIMIDLSRNSALNLKQLKAHIDSQAKLGIDQLFMYMEDVYEIETDAHFGHLRGRYTQEELKALDDYAKIYTIELIPTIQTLAHLRTYLRWPHTQEIQDNHDILLVGSSQTLTLIKDMITSVSQVFSSKKIHIGMDEADMLGLGQYLRNHGFETRHDIMLKHLNDVNKICQDLDLEVLMWSDMFFRLKSPTGDYYDLPIETEFNLSEPIPENIKLVYWDYYQHDEASYIKNIKLHHKLTSNTVFAGGGWTWNGMAPNYAKAIATLPKGLKASQDEAIQESFCTFWFDNGMETPFASALYPIILYADNCYESSDSTLDDWLHLLSGYSQEDFLLLDKFDHIPGTLKENKNADNPSKYIFYQDILQGMFDKQIEDENIKPHYEKLYQALINVPKTNDSYGQLFQYYETFAKILFTKIDLGTHLYQSYHQQDEQALKDALNTIDTLTKDIQNMKDLRESIWDEECKIFGFEVLDIRYGGVITRLMTAKKRIKKYLDKTIDTIDELEAPRLLYKKNNDDPNHSICRVDNWQDIISAGNIAGI